VANNHWYAKKNNLPAEEHGMKRVDCPCCGGKGRRKDEKTHLERPCVGCGGIGVVKVFR